MWQKFKRRKKFRPSAGSLPEVDYSSHAGRKGIPQPAPFPENPPARNPTQNLDLAFRQEVNFEFLVKQIQNRQPSFLNKVAFAMCIDSAAAIELINSIQAKKLKDQL